jgi:hypothetical protein
VKKTVIAPRQGEVASGGDPAAHAAAQAAAWPRVLALFERTLSLE